MRNYSETNYLVFCFSRVAKLELIGFSWRVGQDWKDFYQRLRDYRDRHGNCDFPKQEDARLAAWIDSQRVSYKYRELSKVRTLHRFLVSLFHYSIVTHIFSRSTASITGAGRQAESDWILLCH